MTVHNLSSAWLGLPPIEELPFPEPFTWFQHNPVYRFRDRLILAGKHVLFVGYSEAQAQAVVAQEGIVSAKRLALWRDHIDADGAAFPVVIGDICKRTEFADDTFDAVLFLSVWEHLHNIDGACRECARITRDGGLVFTEFGPVWTGPTGHHIYHDAGNPALDFTLRQLPTHMHLLYDRETVISYLVRHRGIESRAAREATEIIYVTDNINRTPAHVYFKAAARQFRVMLQENYTSPIPAEVLRLLQTRHPHLGHFDFEGGAWILIVDKAI